MKACSKDLFLLAALIAFVGWAFPGGVTAQNFTALHSFSALDYASGLYANADGGSPYGGLTLSDKTLYGTTTYGGSSGAGAVYRVNMDGTGFETVHSFASIRPFPWPATNNEGGYPYASLILSGNTLYGTAHLGGSWGNGTVFALDTDGTGFRNLHTFTGLSDRYTNSDGANPHGRLLLSGNTLFGTAVGGGSGHSGTVFALSTNGTGFVILHSFTPSDPFVGANSDGAFPFGGLVLSGSTLYGTAWSGGSSGVGTVFALNTDGTGFKTLHNFTAIPYYTNSDGAYPYAGLLLSGSTLYGTTVQGGSGVVGTVFAVKTDGTGFATLHSFARPVFPAYSNRDGFNPFADLILSGNTLYGTAQSGGDWGKGSVFALRTDGTGFTTMHSFTTISDPYYTNDDGAAPWGGLILWGNTLYGTASVGGGSANGVVFRLSAHPAHFR